MSHFSIESALSALLQEHDCVVVPHLGSFVLQYRSAEFSRDGGQLYPPGNYLTFNASIAGDDGVLLNYATLNHYSGNYDIAKYKVGEAISGLRLQLSSGSRVYLDHIGVLQQEEGKVLFKPLLKLPYSIQQYGLGKVASLESVSELIIRRTDKAAVWPTAVAATILFLIGLSVLFPLTQVVEDIDVSSAAIEVFTPDVESVDKKKEYSSISKDEEELFGFGKLQEEEGSFVTEAEVVEALQIPESEAPKPALKHAPKPIAIESNSYAVVVASFITLEDAIDQLATIQAKAPNARIINMNKRYRIAAAIVDNQAAAATELASYRTSFEDAWLLAL